MEVREATSAEATSDHPSPTIAPVMERLTPALEILAVIAVSRGSLWLLPRPVPTAVAAIVSVAVPLIVATLLLRHRGETWADLGLRRPTSWPWTLLVLAVTFVGANILVGLIAQPLLRLAGVPPQDLSAFQALEGNLQAFLVMLIPVGWGSAAFGEEMLGRGFLMHRFARLFGGGRIGWTGAVIAQSIVFGLGHSYQGPAGMVVTGATGLALGLGYLMNRRNLWAVILAHGLIDTVGLLAAYLGLIHLLTG